VVGGLLELLAGALEVGLGDHPLRVAVRPHRAGERPPALGVVGVADPVAREGGIVAAGVSDGVLDLLAAGQFRHVARAPGVLDHAVVVDDEHRSFGESLADVVLEVDAVCLGDVVAGIGEEGNVQVVLVGEGRVAVEGVRPDREHLDVLLHRE